MKNSNGLLKPWKREIPTGLKLNGIYAYTNNRNFFKFKQIFIEYLQALCLQATPCG